MDLYTTETGKNFGKVNLVKETKNKITGRREWTGAKGLKASQHYPNGFGVAVRKTFVKHRQQVALRMATIRASAVNSRKRMKNDMWADADLASVIEFITS